MQLNPWPSYDQEEIKAACATLQTGLVNYWTGEIGRTFEQAFAAHCGTPYAVAVANGSLALELALLALNIGPGDEVIVPCRTFVATALGVLRVGAKPVIVDVDGQSQNITLKHIKAAWSARTKAVIVVHIGGLPCEMTPIMQWVAQQGAYLVEDCAQAQGARYRGKMVGSLGTVGVFSFCQDKIMSTGGEGGMLVTHDRRIWQAAWSIKDHGKHPSALMSTSPMAYRWLVQQVGTNMRMTEFQAAIGLAQLKKLPDWLAKRNHYAQILDTYLADCAMVQTTKVPPYMYGAYYKYYGFLAPQYRHWQRLLLQRLLTLGIPARLGSCPDISEEQALQAYRHGQHLEATLLGQTSFMLPVHPTLTEPMVHQMGQLVRRLLFMMEQML